MQHSNFHTIKSISVITIIVSFILSLASTKLGPIQDRNIEIDQKRNILKSIGLDISSYNENNIINEYKSRIKNIILDLKGNLITNINHADLKLIENNQTGQISYFHDQSEYLLAYKSLDPSAFIIPISGKGLWSTLYGYFALQDDYNTVNGITFYEHGETAGLGGEVEKKWFQDNFIGKKIYNENDELISIMVVKGKASDVLNDEFINHGVDGISGATITSNGVTNFLLRDLKRFKIFFDKKRTY